MASSVERRIDSAAPRKVVLMEKARQCRRRSTWRPGLPLPKPRAAAVEQS
jgi:hypothetical protein